LGFLGKAGKQGGQQNVEGHAVFEKKHNSVQMGKKVYPVDQKPGQAEDQCVAYDKAADGRKPPTQLCFPPEQIGKTGSALNREDTHRKGETEKKKF